jgi:hypothetical protein
MRMGRRKEGLSEVKRQRNGNRKQANVFTSSIFKKEKWKPITNNNS